MVVKVEKTATFDFNGHVSPKTKERLAGVAEQSIAAAKTLDNIRQILGIVEFGNPPAGIDPSDSISRLAEPVKKLQRAPTEPCVTETTRQAILKSYYVLDAMCVAEPPFARAMGEVPGHYADGHKGAATGTQHACTIWNSVVRARCPKLGAGGHGKRLYRAR